MKNTGYFTDEWCHPGKQEARAQKSKLLDGVQVTDHIGQNHETQWIGGFRVMLGADWSEVKSE